MMQLKNKQIRLFAGAMSKECVDAVLKIKKVENKVGFISSRRQIDTLSGYVNGWSTKDFHSYVRARNKKVLLCRDHGGCAQGQQEDDGMESFLNDLNYLDIIHVDPWKKYKSIEEGTRKTVEYIKLLHLRNNNTKFEIGTEEAIRYFSFDDMHYFLKNVKINLTEKEYDSIVYCVVQSGVGLNLQKMINTGEYSQERLSKMIGICRHYNLLTKEHNSDYLDVQSLKNRFNEGLDAVNIAPELGQIQTQIFLENISKKLFEEFFEICLLSKKWVKWVDSSFDPYKNKKELILTCGHYIFDQDFVRNNFLNNSIIKKVEKNIQFRVESIINSLEVK